ncbi:MAG: YihA family ribosome biogenesis GTP-binding protein [Burkholderiales bacterium]|nr:YihA family ribosome biogenesis GTP-binding protein [Burkholderiales bacterium]MBH2017590.1 YihA family ribosome biogenesis GTP-binding protein [Burkholderiales bacterium]
MTRSTPSRPKASTNPGPKRRPRPATQAGQRPAQASPSPHRDPSADPAHEAAKASLAWAHSARFYTTAALLKQLPASDLPEIAFVGRSNAGKSTAINTLAQQRQLAFASKTPGRTQHINLFHLGPKAAPDQVWTDLPGYGYAAVERTAKLRWQEVMADYLAWRRNLCAVVQMVDCRHGFTDLDKQLLGFVAPRVRNGEVKLLVLLTKADKLNRKEQAESLRAAQAVLAELSTDESDIGLTLFSALNKSGVGDVAGMLNEWALSPEAAEAIAAATALAAAEAEAAAIAAENGDVTADPPPDNMT